MHMQYYNAALENVSQDGRHDHILKRTKTMDKRCVHYKMKYIIMIATVLSVCLSVCSDKIVKISQRSPTATPDAEN